MRHRVKGRKLSRTSEHRRATLRNLATSLLKHKKITTTSAKAKELRSFVEPLITRAKSDSVAARRFVASDISDKSIVKELFSEIVPKIGERPGGYTRIVKLGQRKGDGAELSIIELVDYSGITKPKSTKKEKGEVIKPESKTEDTKDEISEDKKETKIKAKKAPAKTKKSSEKKETKEKKEVKTKKAPAKKSSKTKKSEE